MSAKKNKNTKKKNDDTVLEETEQYKENEDVETEEEIEVLPNDSSEDVPCNEEDTQETVVVDNELQEKLDASNKKAEEYLNLAQRVQADFDNFRRRNQNTRAEAYEDGAKAFITTLLPVLDNLERAMEATKDAQDKSLVDGVLMVKRQLEEAFDKRGVKPIDRKGEKFDPNLENAVLQGTDEDGEPGTVCEVFQKGYKLGDSVLRHAMVKVVPE